MLHFRITLSYIFFKGPFRASSPFRVTSSLAFFSATKWWRRCLLPSLEIERPYYHSGSTELSSVATSDNLEIIVRTMPLGFAFTIEKLVLRIIGKTVNACKKHLKKRLHLLFGQWRGCWWQSFFPNGNKAFVRNGRNSFFNFIFGLGSWPLIWIFLKDFSGKVILNSLHRAGCGCL